MDWKTLARKIKNLHLLTLSSFINLILFPSKRIREKSILLIRLDAIGDYVLFRNFIEILKKHPRYSGYRITLLGNIVWKELALELDGAFVDEFIWLDRRSFAKNFLYRYKKLREICSIGYETVISPVYSREFYFSDWIAYSVHAKEKIASIGNYSNISRKQKKRSDQWFTRLIPAKEAIVFEFYRNREFFSNLLGEELAIARPNINLQNTARPASLPEKYAVLFIGASAKFRKWPAANFAEVARHLQQEFGLAIVLAGGPSDTSDARDFQALYHGEVCNMVGKTSLPDLVRLLFNAEILLSNETSAPHIATALGNCQVIVLYNGNHFGRFVPYPEPINAKYHVIFHPTIQDDTETYQKNSNMYGFRSTLDISDIPLKTVIQCVRRALGAM
jgi:ADP-heptose:LPS heptosyltransferase